MSSPRACGSRVAGGCYIELPLSRTGRPLSDFILCPPREIDLMASGLSSIGIKLLRDAEGTYHVFDVVGEEFYPNVSDFIEEVARLGVSRRIAKNTDFSKLSRKSCLFVVHRRALIRNHAELQEADRTAPSGFVPTCAARTHNDEEGARIPCSKFWWNDVRGLDEAGIRHMATFSYWGSRPLEDLRYSPAIFAGFPIVRLAVIRDGGSYEETARKASRARHISIEIEED